MTGDVFISFWVMKWRKVELPFYIFLSSLKYI